MIEEHDRTGHGTSTEEKSGRLGEPDREEEGGTERGKEEEWRGDRETKATVELIEYEWKAEEGSQIDEATSACTARSASPHVVLSHASVPLKPPARSFLLPPSLPSTPPVSPFSLASSSLTFYS